MKIAVLGTGTVGKRLADGFSGQGHDVRLGSRTASETTATFEEAAEWCDLALLAVSGAHALTVAQRAGPGLAGKVLIDLTNPLDFSNGFPPTLSVCNTDSLGQQIQAALPEVHVVKTLNTLANELMLSPATLDAPTDLLMCGNDESAKKQVAELLQTFGWEAPIDLGGIEHSVALEAWLLLWTRLYGALGHGAFNVKLVGARPQ